MSIEIEEIKNLIVSDVPTIRMWRMTYLGKRGYVLREPFTIYSGLTGSLSAATFKGNQDAKRLQGWRDSMIDQLGSIEKQEAYLNSMADFGTAIHQILVTIKQEGKLNWKYEQEYAEKFFLESARKHGIIPSMDVIKKQVFEYCKSAASLLQFCYDNVVEITAIESMCKSDSLGIATPVDLVGIVKTKALGDIRVSLNIKTSSQFSGHQREQVAIEKYLWNETYPDYQVQKTGLLRPKSWLLKKGIPSYEWELLDEQQEHEITKDALARLMLCKSNPNSTYLNYPTSVQVFTGETKLGELPKIGFRTMEEIFNETINQPQI